MLSVGCSGPIPVVHPQHSGPKLGILITVITITAILSDLILDTKVETANGAIDVHSISIRFIVVLRLIRSYGAGWLASGEVLASVGPNIVQLKGY